jgi:HD-GYP domain-containing protein (c-di-GMP phosphodiesterase class II)
VGAEVVSRVPALRALAPLIRAHHERWGGHGDPHGLSREAVPLGARIVGVANAYAARTSDRPYRRAGKAAWALEELRRAAGTRFDATVVAALERVLAADRALEERAGGAGRSACCSAV